MNFRPITLLLLALCLLGMSSCSTNSLQKRIANNPSHYNNLSPQDKNLVNNGKISKGMDKQAVYLAWGSPSRSTKGNKNNTLYERWYYHSYTPYDFDPFYYDYRRSCYRSRRIRTNDYKVELESQVEFRKGIVYSWEAAQ